jgi:chorismate dehydratase
MNRLERAKPSRKPRVCAVSYLNTAPLVWGFIDGPQKGSVDLSFAVPSTCAERTATGVADVGLNPVMEVSRCGFAWLPGTGIASKGAVRSILLVSRRPFDEIRTLATDTGSRTSVELSRIILARKYGGEPSLLPMAPDLPKMLDQADAALLIGDAALSVEPTGLDHACLDLGEEWTEMTGLPMVYAVWSGLPDLCYPSMADLFIASAEHGLTRLDHIVEHEADQRGFRRSVVRTYLNDNVHFLLRPEDYEGMRTFLAYAAELHPALMADAKAH